MVQNYTRLYHYTAAVLRPQPPEDLLPDHLLGGFGAVL